MKPAWIISGVLAVALVVMAIAFGVTTSGLKQQNAALAAEDTQFRGTIRDLTSQSEHFVTAPAWTRSTHAQSTKRLGATACFECHEETFCSDCHTNLGAWYKAHPK